jgi:hypothetical protein
MTVAAVRSTSRPAAEQELASLFDIMSWDAAGWATKSAMTPEIYALCPP